MVSTALRNSRSSSLVSFLPTRSLFLTIAWTPLYSSSKAYASGGFVSDVLGIYSSRSASMALDTATDLCVLCMLLAGIAAVVIDGSDYTSEEASTQ
jgi:hypothetical protein